MKLSIIVPVYNVEKYVSDCLDSLLNQDLAEDEYEIICVDDGSKDASGAILDEYAKNHSNIVVIHKENAGVSAARNDALDIAKGEYVHFVDSDDYFYPQVYGQLVDLATREEADVLLFGYEKVEAERSYRDCNFVDGKVLCEATEHPEIELSLMACLNIIKRSLIETYAIRFGKGIFYGEDTLFEDQVACRAQKVIRVNERLYFYRQGTGITARTDEQTYQKRMFSCYKVAVALKELRGTVNEKERAKFLNRRVSEFVALTCINSLRCQKGIAKQIRRQMAEDKLYPYAASPLLYKVKKDIHNSIPVLLKFRLFFWVFDTFNVFRK